MARTTIQQQEFFVIRFKNASTGLYIGKDVNPTENLHFAMRFSKRRDAKLYCLPELHRVVRVIEILKEIG